MPNTTVTSPSLLPVSQINSQVRTVIKNLALDNEKQAKFDQLFARLTKGASNGSKIEKDRFQERVHEVLVGWGVPIGLLTGKRKPNQEATLRLLAAVKVAAS